jgi:hypothetical protein
MKERKVLSGWSIVIADRGWVYVGQCDHDGEWCIITDAKCIRKWGTTEGIGELVAGPTHKTVADQCGTVRVPARAIIGMIDTEEKSWKKS